MLAYVNALDSLLDTSPLGQWGQILHLIAQWFPNHQEEPKSYFLSGEEGSSREGEGKGRGRRRSLPRPVAAAHGPCRDSVGNSELPSPADTFVLGGIVVLGSFVLLDSRSEKDLRKPPNVSRPQKLKATVGRS
ncbi:Unconventional Prefoldin Rpb5 Interactor 1 [Manis pentadactyla]|nr:Unconventional Prefoldin Rpb5 Interactor 1 [Manis pentadactyla]